MPGYGGDDMGWWIIFPIVFMAFMLFMMLRMMSGGGPMGMMGGGHQHGTDVESQSPRQSTRGGSDANESPIEVARRRYASGEISREEFQRIRDDLD